MPWTPFSEDELRGSSPLREAPAQRRPHAIRRVSAGSRLAFVVAPESTSVRPRGAADAAESSIRGGSSMSRSLSFLDRRRGSLAGAILAAAFFLAGSSSQAVVVLSGTGTGVNPISASAIFEFGAGGDPNLLDITLINTSTVPTRYPADVLTSFYFDICKPGRGGTMISPPLGYVSAVGRVFQVQSGTGNDIPAVYFPPLPPSTTGTFFQPLPGTSDLRALNNGANTWQFKMMDTGSAPFYQYGVGTVGNSTSGTTGYVWSPNNFEAQKVGQGEFGIYSGESPTLQNQLENRYLVSGSITFRFSGVNGFGDECIKDAMFGFGTSPDAVINLPEPGGLAACGLLAAAILGGLSRPRAPRSLAAALGFAAVVVAILIAMPAVEAGPVRAGDRGRRVRLLRRPAGMDGDAGGQEWIPATFRPGHERPVGAWRRRMERELGPRERSARRHRQLPHERADRRQRPGPAGRRQQARRPDPDQHRPQVRLRLLQRIDSSGRRPGGLQHQRQSVRGDQRFGVADGQRVCALAPRSVRRLAALAGTRESDHAREARLHAPPSVPIPTCSRCSMRAPHSPVRRRATRAPAAPMCPAWP